MKVLSWSLYILTCLLHGLLSSYLGYGLLSWERWATLSLIYLLWIVSFINGIETGEKK